MDLNTILRVKKTEKKYYSLINLISSKFLHNRKVIKNVFVKLPNKKEKI